MHVFLRFSLFAWISITLVSCQQAGSAGNLLMAPLGLAERMLGAVGRTAGVSAAVDNPDATSNSVAERGKIIENRGEWQAPAVPQTAIVAQR